VQLTLTHDMYTVQVVFRFLLLAISVLAHLISVSAFSLYQHRLRFAQ
jgi:hypothetical protein